MLRLSMVHAASTLALAFATFVSVCHATPGETCPAAATINSVPFNATFDNASASDGTPSPSCNEPSPVVAPHDGWYVWTPATSCPDAYLSIQSIDPNLIDPVVGVYSGADCNNLVEVACHAHVSYHIPFSALAGTTYWIQIADHNPNGDGGWVVLELYCSVCGNSVLETEGGEICDDGNALDGDGCEHDCTLTPPVNDNCPAATNITNGSLPVDLSAATSGGVPACGPTESMARDQWYDYSATCNGSLIVDTCGGGALPTVIAVYDGPECPVVASNLACSDANDCPSSDGTKVLLPVQVGQSLKLRVGTPAELSATGPDMLNVACIPTQCGNGTIELGEGCDDANAIDGDGCDSNCTPTACGNGVVTSGEQCDDGNTLNLDGCSAGCQVEPPCLCTTVADCRGSLCAFDNPCNHASCDAGICTWSCTAYGDINASGSVNLDDLLATLRAFQNYPSQPNADLHPCGGNGIINMDDILSALAAFGGYDPCGCDLSAPTLRCGVAAP